MQREGKSDDSGSRFGQCGMLTERLYAFGGEKMVRRRMQLLRVLKPGEPGTEDLGEQFGGPSSACGSKQ